MKPSMQLSTEEYWPLPSHPHLRLESSERPISDLCIFIRRLSPADDHAEVLAEVLTVATMARDIIIG